jgi:hypothetical protein
VSYYGLKELLGLAARKYDGMHALEGLTKGLLAVDVVE